ncbi:hypothetical protein BS17DRAFT_827708 [Gyrodon lividus]|nr:hypothetical protein BS17DRAFT_827708 [Gyrodon lividus]
MITLSIFTCHPAPLQLLALGLFGCAPVSPSLAVDLCVLELMKALFVHMTPNMSGWSEALEAFLNDQRYKLATDDNLRQWFSTTYHWYLILTIMVAEHVSNLDVDVSDSKHTQSSQYLRAQCPLCFGGKDWECNGDGTDDIDVIVCIDACFTQKCSCNACNNVTHDPPNPAQTIFISESDIKAINSNVCGDSFIAADKKHEKVSMHYFADTGLMVMLCHCDHVPWLVNMMSAGEKQHSVLVLIQCLFDHLPLDMSVGLLYDIGCQLGRSFVYHPWKCVGFGLSDGEGCEHLWSFLKPLISFHQWLFVLDYQVFHLYAKSLEGFGDWLHWQWMHCWKKMAATSKALALLDIKESILRDQWADQVAHQTVPLVQQAKNKGEEEIARVLGLEKILEHQQIVIDDLEHQLAMDSICDVAELNICLIEARHKLIMTTTLVEKCRAALGCNVYLQVCMNAQAVKTCIWERLSTIIPYATSCRGSLMVGQHLQGQSPLPVYLVKVYIGLNNTTADPPLWLVDENVHMSICHLLEYDQCVEEEARLCHEWCVLQEWMISEQNNLQQAREKAAGNGLQEEELTEDGGNDDDVWEEEEEEGVRLWDIDIGDDELMAEAEEAALTYEYQLHGQDDDLENVATRYLSDDDESHSREDNNQLPSICNPPAKRLKI